ncbi:FecR family protein [Naasia lichenicola]|nr:FecR domain-containing protein [Naasia lichenicola]
MRTSLSRLAVGVAVLFVLAGCTASPAGPSANVTASATLVSILTGDSSRDLNGTTPQTAAVGDTVRTDSSGSAQLDYADGSLTRLGPATELTVTELSDASAQRTVVELKVGQTWHRVEKLVAEDAAFEVSTPVGVASVHGTAFAVTCTAEEVCTVQVLDGEVGFTLQDGTELTIAAGEQLVVPAADGGDPTVEMMTAGQLADDWLTHNLDLDAGGSAAASSAPPVEADGGACSNELALSIVPNVTGEATPVESFTGPTELTSLPTPSCLLEVTQADGGLVYLGIYFDADDAFSSALYESFENSSARVSAPSATARWTRTDDGMFATNYYNELGLVTLFRTSDPGLVDLEGRTTNSKYEAPEGTPPFTAYVFSGIENFQ